MTSDIRVVVDQLLASQKKPLGVASWVDEHREGDQRIRHPLLVDGEVSDATLTVIAFPRQRDLRFRLVLSFSRAIWRLDYVHDEEHYNSFNRPSDLTLGPFERLENARILDANLKMFDNTFRWFCGQTNIDISELGVPALPTTDRLL